MKHRGIIAAIIIFALIIVGMFIFAFLKKSEIAEIKTPVIDTPVVDPYADITRIDAKHFFENGKHTITGELLMPTTCDLLNWNTALVGDTPQVVTIGFAVINNSKDCEPKVTPQRFMVPFDAREDALLEATLNGRKVELNLIPAGKDERPEDFELFIKG